MRHAAIGAMAALALVPLARASEPPIWADGTSPQTKETCRVAVQRALPSADPNRPPPAHCDLVWLYDGLSGPPFYLGVLSCALLGKRGDDKGPLTTDAMLSMLYANGYGVARDDNLAIAYACRTGWPGAEMDARIDHLLSRKKQGAAAKLFDFCDDATSGHMQSYCTSRKERATEAVSPAALDDLVRRSAPPVRVALAPLIRAHDAYVKAIADHEVDQSGSSWATIKSQIAAENKETANFVAALRKILPPAQLEGTADDEAKADARLNDRYKRVHAVNESHLGTVTHAGITTTERAWLAYRDAFLAFEATVAPAASRNAVSTLLTEQRTAKLGKLLGDDPPLRHP